MYCLSSGDEPGQFRRERAGNSMTDPVKDSVAAAQMQFGGGEVKIVRDGDHITTLTKREFTSAVLEFNRSDKPK
jgi:hypothetical protein